jgi:pimeloyl-ACP methyl ester carboxylesterase
VLVSEKQVSRNPASARDLTPTLSTISAPTLFSTGTEDPMWTPAEAAAASRRLPHGAFVTLPGAGHIAPLLEAAPSVVDLLTAFWRDPAAVVLRRGASGV